MMGDHEKNEWTPSREEQTYLITGGTNEPHTEVITRGTNGPRIEVITKGIKGLIRRPISKSPMQPSESSREHSLPETHSTKQKQNGKYYAKNTKSFLGKSICIKVLELS